MQQAATIIMDIDLDNLSALEYSFTAPAPHTALEYSLIDARIPGITLHENVIAVEKGELNFLK